MLFYLDDNDILSKFQYGFRPNRSTQQSIFEFSKFIYSGVNNKKIVPAICLDVCKAFDCINHDILLAKLRKIGFSDLTLSWFKSYLTRTQTVCFNKVESDVMNVRTGIGQGTILGPLIFIFYINDIVTSIGRLKINMYADDCILFISGNNWERMIDNVQSDLDNVQMWCDRNKLKLSTTKSKTLLFGSVNKLKQIDYSKTLRLSDCDLIYVDRYKYLGIILDQHLTLTPLIADVKRKISGHLFRLRKLRRLITVDCALAIYKQIILPVFDYAGFMLYSANQSDRSDLQVLQNDALRTCYFVRRRDRVSVKNLHRKAKLLSLDQRRQIQLLLLMYNHKSNNNVARLYNRNTRGADRYHFHLERYNTIKYRNSPYCKGTELWDMLRDSTIESDTLFMFKSNLKKEINTYHVP